MTGDSRIPKDFAVFPLTVRVPVGVAAKVIFANITGPPPPPFRIIKLADKSGLGCHSKLSSVIFIM